MLHVRVANDDLVGDFFYYDLHDFHCPISKNSLNALWIQTVVQVKLLIFSDFHKSTIDKYRSLFVAKALAYFHILTACQ